MIIDPKALLRSVLGVLLLVPACDEGGGLLGPRPLAREDLVGAYLATTLLVTFEPGDIDVIAGGGTLFMTLEPAGTTTGMLFVPEEVAGEEVTADLSGTWLRRLRCAAPLTAFWRRQRLPWFSDCRAQR